MDLCAWSKSIYKNPQKYASALCITEFFYYSFQRIHQFILKLDSTFCSHWNTQLNLRRLTDADGTTSILHRTNNTLWATQCKIYIVVHCDISVILSALEWTSPEPPTNTGQKCKCWRSFKIWCFSYNIVGLEKLTEKYVSLNIDGRDASWQQYIWNATKIEDHKIINKHTHASTLACTHTIWSNSVTTVELYMNYTVVS